MSKRGDANKARIEWVLRAHFKPEQIKREHKGIKGRLFRFDWAIPEYKLAIEYEGIFSNKSRHTSVTGYATDCEKYNLATLQGWKVLRYTATNYQMLDVNLKIFKRDHINP